MALLWNASLTDAGVSMISQWAQGTGNKLTITGGVIGEGVVAATQLHTLTQLTDQKSTISIQGFESVANGVKLKLRKTSQGITTSFILNQIGIYAKLDTSGGTPIIADSLIAVYQQDTGVLVPTEADSPDFVFTFYGTVQTNYSGDLTINVDTSALASQDDLDALTLAGLADTDADTPAEDNLLFFKGSTDKWTAQANPFSNENLLDNPWFTVNQRGATTITTNNAYGADMWHKDDGSTLTFSSNGVTVDNVQMGQWREEQLPNGIYTLSVMLTNGTIYSNSFNKTNDTGEWEVITTADTGTFKAGYTATTKNIWVNTAGTGSTVSVRAVKLEVGSVSTLANDVAPNYTTELLKCQRYFKRIQAKENAAHLTIGAAITATTVYAIIPLPVPLRTTPTLSYSGSLVFLTGGNAISVSSVSLYEKTESTVTLVMSLASSVTAGVCGSVNLSTAGDYIDLASNL